MANITTSTIMSPAVAQMYAYKLLASRTRACIHSMALQEKQMPTGQGNTMVFRTMEPLKLVKAPLGNSGATPPAQTLKKLDIYATPEWYGTYVIINEQAILTNENPLLNIAAEQLGICMKETDDELTRDALAGCASKHKCVYGNNGDTPTNVSLPDMSKAFKTLLGNDAKPMLEGFESANKFGVSPVKNSYFALCHTDLCDDLEQMDKFVDVSRYADQKNVNDAEYGACAGFRFFVSSAGSKSAEISTGGKTIYNILCIAKDAAGRVALKNNAKFVYKDAMDPLGQNYSAAVKWNQTIRIYNDTYLLKVECTEGN